METAPAQFIDAARALVSHVEMNASLTTLVGESMERQARGGPAPDGYLRVTDVVNSAAAFWSRRRPDIGEPEEIARKLASGKAKHRTAAFWLSGVPGFVFGEGRVEGAYVGLKGVVGRIDFLLLGRHVIEYKTKSVLPDDPTQVWDDYPMDVEQTAFYGVLLPKSSDDHYLVFDSDGTFRCFRVRLVNRGEVANALRQRSDNLWNALSSGDPSRLGRCRYFTSGCRFAAAGACACASLPEVNVAALRRAIEVTRDPEFEQAVAKAYEEGGPDEDAVWWWDLLAPRRRFKTDPPSYSQPVWKNACRWLLQEGVRGVPTLRVGNENYHALARGAQELGLRVPSDLLLARRAGRADEGQAVPYIARAARGPMKAYWQLNPYYVAELAVLCAAAGSVRGVIIVMYPEDHNKVAAYDVTFRDVREVRHLVQSSVRRIREAEEQGDPSLLPECPVFMRDGCGAGCLCGAAATGSGLPMSVGRGEHHGQR